MNFSLLSAQDVLSRTPGGLRAMLDGVDDGWTRSNYGPGTWSAHEVVAHLIFGERTDWVPRARLIMAHGDSRPFEPFDRAGHAAIAAGHSTGELLDIFDRERRANLAALAGMKLTETDLDRRGRHPALGGVTLRQLLATWVVHDLNHTGQIAKAMAYQCKAQVGPWEAYLSILSPPNPR